MAEERPVRSKPREWEKGWRRDGWKVFWLVRLNTQLPPYGTILPRDHPRLEVTKAVLN